MRFRRRKPATSPVREPDFVLDGRPVFVQKPDPDVSARRAEKTRHEKALDAAIARLSQPLPYGCFRWPSDEAALEDLQRQRDQR